MVTQCGGIAFPPWMGPGNLAQCPSITDLHWNWIIGDLALSTMHQYHGGPREIEKCEFAHLRDALKAQIYSHKSKRSMCRSIAEVRRQIFQGEKLKAEIDPKTKAVTETKIGVADKKSKKRKGEFSISKKESAAKKHKNNGHDNYDNIEVEKFLKDARKTL
ncbi:hypothetical protein FXO37_12665 [Capsicum annuum]|nr:hypothetical protein FXO37_12665 [Capsicum annuum]